MNKKILGICGSLRADSWNLKLLKNFLAKLDRAGHQTTLYPTLEMPLVNEDLETKPLDARITNFRQALKAADVVVIASPEYNGSFSSALKNAVDWGTRNENLWAGKTVILAAASPGGFGGIRGLIQLRTVLSGIKSWILPEQVLMPHSDKAFSAEGKLEVEAVSKQMDAAIESLHNFLGR